MAIRRACRRDCVDGRGNPVHFFVRRVGAPFGSEGRNQSSRKEQVNCGNVFLFRGQCSRKTRVRGLCRNVLDGASMRSNRPSRMPADAFTVLRQMGLCPSENESAPVPVGERRADGSGGRAAVRQITVAIRWFPARTSGCAAVTPPADRRATRVFSHCGAGDIVPLKKFQCRAAAWTDTHLRFVSQHRSAVNFHSDFMMKLL